MSLIRSIKQKRKLLVSVRPKFSFLVNSWLAFHSLVTFLRFLYVDMSNVLHVLVVGFLALVGETGAIRATRGTSLVQRYVLLHK